MGLACNMLKISYQKYGLFTLCNTIGYRLETIPPRRCMCPCHTTVPYRTIHKHTAYTGKQKDPRNGVGTSTKPKAVSVDKIRNIGIMAHIDAGKTTTTERMLYYTGVTRNLGDVDDGDTVMDYMEQERNRGITITSAAISFFWNKYKINLIDTPGHVDFTVEVERCLRVLDGAVAVLDASAGVEAQTLTVWRQADNYDIPRIVFINKMDKRGANFQSSINSLQEKLNVQPLILQQPLGGEDSFRGVVDLITMQQLVWPDSDTGGKQFEKIPVQAGELYDKCHYARVQLIEQLADLDDTVASLVLSDTPYDNIAPDVLLSAVRTATLQRRGVPILCGSSLKNKGVQPLLDAITNFLPGPSDSIPDFVSYYEGELCALAFKILHDKQRGVLTYVRLYSGVMKANSTLYNMNRQCTEKTGRLLEVFADEHKDVGVATEGNIVAISGLKQTITGDTLVASSGVAAKARDVYMKSSSHPQVTSAATENMEDEDSDPDDQPDLAILAGLIVPDPVFFCAVEPQSASQQRALEHALACLTREDPSLRVKVDTETGQTILMGMGELHLEIIHDRIQTEYRVDADLGSVFIAYRETISRSQRVSHTLDRVLGNIRHHVTVSLSVEPEEEHGRKSDAEKKLGFRVAPDPESTLTERPLRPRQKKAVRSGIISAMSRGPILSFPLVELGVTVHEVKLSRGTSLPMLSACVAEAVTKACTDALPLLMEPVMSVEIHTSDEYLGSVVRSQRRSQILEMSTAGDVRTVIALTPLAELMGYSTILRRSTSGTATFSMELSHYQAMSEQHQTAAVAKATGFMPL